MQRIQTTKRPSLFVSVVAAWLTGTVAFAAGPNVGGRLLRLDKTLAANVAVVLRSPALGDSDVTYTGSDGWYYFFNVSPGDYTVWVVARKSGGSYVRVFSIPIRVSNKQFTRVPDEILPEPPEVAAQILELRTQGLSALDKEPHKTETLAKEILKLDGNNGHGLYLLGEARRRLHETRGERDAFERYLHEEPLISTDARGSNKPKGYFDERTAYIALLLADSYSLEALHERESADSNWNAKALQACNWLKVSDDKQHKEFSSPSTSVVRGRVEDLLGRKCL